MITLRYFSTRAANRMILNLSFFSSRYETILENQEKVNRDVIARLGVADWHGLLRCVEV